MPKISDLTSKASPATTDIIPVVTPGNTDNFKATLASLPISTAAQAALDLKAPLASPALTGTPTVPTAAVDTSTTQAASTAYVVGQGYLKAATATATYAPIASPTLTGVPAAPTAAANTNTTQIATTAYVKAITPNVSSPITATHTEINRLTGSTGILVGRAFAEYATSADLTTTIPYDDTIPQITEGTQIISVAYTALSATNRLRFRFMAAAQTTTSATNVQVALFKVGTADALKGASVATAAASVTTQICLEHEMVAGSTSAQTYTIRIGPQANTLRLNGATTGRVLGGTQSATLIIEEYSV